MKIEPGKYYIDRNFPKVYINGQNKDANDAFNGCFHGYYVNDINEDLNKPSESVYFTEYGETVWGVYDDGRFAYGPLGSFLVGELSEVKNGATADKELDCKCDIKALFSYGHEKGCVYK